MADTANTLPKDNNSIIFSKFHKIGFSGKIKARIKIHELSYSQKTQVVGPNMVPELLSPEPTLSGTELQSTCSLKGFH